MKAIYKVMRHNRVLFVGNVSVTMRPDGNGWAIARNPVGNEVAKLFPESTVLRDCDLGGCFSWQILELAGDKWADAKTREWRKKLIIINRNLTDNARLQRLKNNLIDKT